MPDPHFLNLHLWLETTRLPYAGYDHILSKQTGEPKCPKRTISRLNKTTGDSIP